MAVGPRRPVSAARRRLLLVLGGLLLAATTACGEDPMTVIVISLDTTRPDHLTPYGYDRDTTPTLARLADEGARFTQARSTTSWTLPSHMSLFTGLPPSMHEVVLDQAVLHPSRRTMGEVFEGAGFTTMGFYSAPYVHEQFGFDRGIRYYQRCVKPTVWDIPPAQRKAQLDRLEAESHRQQSTPEVMQRGLRSLKNLGTDRTLLFMHLFDPHYDFLAPRPLVNRFADPDYSGDIDGRDVYTTAVVEGDISDADKQQLKDLYDAELAFVDKFLEGLMETLKRQGRLEDTLLVITSDHGEAFYEDGRFGHRNDLREEVLRIPLIVWGPRFVPDPVVVDDAVSLVDVLPTLMDYAGIAPDETMYGRSLRPLIEARPLPPRPHTASLHVVPRPEGDTMPDHFVWHESIVHEGFKYNRRVHKPWDHRKPNDLGGDPLPDTLVESLYDLSSDPGETTDIAGEQPDRLKRMRELMAIERKAQGEAARLHFGGQGALHVDPGLDMIELLRGVGYVELDSAAGDG